MRPRGKDVKRARMIMIAVFLLALAVSLVYALISYDFSDSRVFNKVETEENTQLRSIRDEW